MTLLCLFLVLFNFLIQVWSIEPPALQKPLMIPPELRLGERADVICTLRRGDLPVTFKWYFNGREIRGEELGKVTSYDVRSSVYLMDKLRAENVGNYTCMVTNSAGSDTASGQLLVEGILIEYCTHKSRNDKGQGAKSNVPESMFAVAMATASAAKHPKRNSCRKGP